MGTLGPLWTPSGDTGTPLVPLVPLGDTPVTLRCPLVTLWCPWGPSGATPCRHCPAGGSGVPCPGVPLPLPAGTALPAGPWGLSPASALGAAAAVAAATGEPPVALGDSCGAGPGGGVAVVAVPPPLVSPPAAGGRDTTMYFCTVPVTAVAPLVAAPLAALGTAGDTSLTSGCTLGTVVVTGEVAVGAGDVLSVITWGHRHCHLPITKWPQCPPLSPSLPPPDVPNAPYPLSAVPS
ncbi:SH3 domain-containing protein C23A1.17-like, partial [Pyrgilauda ruficollis]|uniref:SH3 domain-containing protein C23A1.17-like n=1 Tax=Pyrgilauda ruficollis TaxID=221976 RepID=UPI001B87C911